MVGTVKSTNIHSSFTQFPCAFPFLPSLLTTSMQGRWQPQTSNPNNLVVVFRARMWCCFGVYSAGFRMWSTCCSRDVSQTARCFSNCIDFCEALDKKYFVLSGRFPKICVGHIFDRPPESSVKGMHACRTLCLVQGLSR